MEIKSMMLEDGVEYNVVDEIVNDNITYVYLANINDESDFCVRKIDNSVDSEMLLGLDSDNEFDKAIILFGNKHKDDNLND